MGFELSVVTVIFFISAVLLGTFSYTMLSTSNEVVVDASVEQHKMQSIRLQTDIEVDDSIPQTSGSNYNLTLILSNTGSETIRFDELNVLVDGTLKSYSYSDVAATWTPAETRNLTVTGLYGLGIHRVKVVTSNGVSAYDSYLV
ncbi:hypothetical protein RE476_12670 [Methanolobus mangrovi]|uniref:Flagellar protein G n=1 Tax=Methanolobus mangrovi TaxID=3072977 RepID=A0AA51UFG1_9EURY|nr:hypothetical protein [Methanolobus mangrovi]WMW22206.1 hypothetical protein RE476_12670 [Methanolobus mangrovi]